MVNDKIDKFFEEAVKKMPNVPYHNAKHAKTVATVANILSSKEELDSEYDMKVVVVAGWFHDTGHSNGPNEGHEKRSCEIFSNVCTNLRESGFQISDDFEQDVEDAIMGTVFLQEPNSKYGKILSDADVWSFGSKWDIFSSKTEAARKEFAPSVSSSEWMAFRATVLEKHEYYTETARELFKDRKKKNIQRIEREHGKLEEPPWQS